jgi:hypothetical protein
MKAFLIFRNLGDQQGTVVEADYFDIEHSVLMFYKVFPQEGFKTTIKDRVILAINAQNWMRVESVEDLKETREKYSLDQHGQATKGAHDAQR